MNKFKSADIFSGQYTEETKVVSTEIESRRPCFSEIKYNTTSTIRVSLIGDHGVGKSAFIDCSIFYMEHVVDLISQ
jgi:ATPase subunit of ABC transporter with duplicated ATPase domains